MSILKGGRDTQTADFNEYKSAELNMKKGRWSLWKEGNDGSSLWHQCSKTREDVFGEDKKSIVLYPIAYRTWSYKTKKDLKPRWCCGMCDKKPPESILVPWLLLNWDDLPTLMELGEVKIKRGNIGYVLRPAENQTAEMNSHMRAYETRPEGAIL